MLPIKCPPNLQYKIYIFASNASNFTCNKSNIFVGHLIYSRKINKSMLSSTLNKLKLLPTVFLSQCKQQDKLICVHMIDHPSIIAAGWLICPALQLKDDVINKIFVEGIFFVLLFRRQPGIGQWAPWDGQKAAYKSECLSSLTGFYEFITLRWSCLSG